MTNHLNTWDWPYELMPAAEVAKLDAGSGEWVCAWRHPRWPLEPPPRPNPPRREPDPPLPARAWPTRRIVHHACNFPTIDLDRHGHGSHWTCEGCGKTWRVNRRGEAVSWASTNSTNGTDSNSTGGNKQ